MQPSPTYELRSVVSGPAISLVSVDPAGPCHRPTSDGRSLASDRLSPALPTADCRCSFDKPIAPAAPWQNGFAERLIGSIRRECPDHLVVLSEARLRQILQRFAAYYNKIRTHRSLDKDAPTFRPVQRIGNIASQAIWAGCITITSVF